MKYVLFVREGGSPVDDPAAGTGSADTLDPEAEAAAYVALKADLITSGVWLGGQALHGQSATTRVEVRRGDSLVVDGPLVESSEQIIGYYLLDCRDLDEAISIAARVPGARRGHVEVRPVWDYEAELGGDRPSGDSGGDPHG